MTLSGAELSCLSLHNCKLDIEKYIMYVHHSLASQGCYGAYEDLHMTLCHSLEIISWTKCSSLTNIN